MMTGTLPTLSANFPLKGLDIIAVNVNSEIIRPLYSAPPNRSRNVDSSGRTILKLAKNNRELTHSNQNCDVYMFSTFNLAPRYPAQFFYYSLFCQGKEKMVESSRSSLRLVTLV